MLNPILRISDGTTTVNLLDLHGWTLDDWKPVVPESKGGGVFRNSPLSDGRKLAYRKMDNVIDTFNLIGSKESQNQMITSIQEIERLLEKAVSYWINDWQNQPVWIEARAANETTSRYATIMDYRLTGFGGPYRQPFFASDCSSTTEAILVIEHMIWQETIPGNSGTCVELSSQYYSPDVNLTYTKLYYPASSDQDATFSPHVEPVGDYVGHHIDVGFGSTLKTPLFSGNCIAGIIFNNVDIPYQANIIKATITLTAWAPAVGSGLLYIFGQDPSHGDATNYDGTNADFTSRNYVNRFALQYLNATEYPGAIDVTATVKCIVGDVISEPSTGWNSGDRMAFRLEYQPELSTLSGRYFCSFDEGGNVPVLKIEYADTGYYFGRSATCNQEVFVANKHNKAALSHIFIYDADGAQYNENGNYSKNLLTQALPYQLLPTATKVGDMVYFGSDTLYSDGGVFNNAIFNLSVIQSGITGVWKYYDVLHGHFQDFTVDGGPYNELCGDEQSFLTIGTGSIVFSQDEYWTTTDVNGVTGYWICFEVTAVSAPTPPTQATRHVYTTIDPFVDIDEAQVKGDIPALARIMFDSAACAWRSMNSLVIALRSLSRGEEFTAYLNASDTQNLGGAICTPNATLAAHFDTDTTSPTGRVINLGGFNPGDGVWSNICYWTIAGNTARQYIGTYHAYVRGVFPAISANRGDQTFRLRAVFGDEFNITYSDSNSPTFGAGAGSAILDLGQFTINPSYTIRPSDTVDYIRIYLDAYCEDIQPSWALTWIHDIIIMPSDEWIGNFGMPSTSVSAVMQYGKGLDIDAVTNPRQYRASETTIITPSASYNDAYRSIAAEWSRIASSEPILQSNRDQRLWFMQFQSQQYGMSYSIENCGKVCAQRSSRYIFARGSR